MILACWLMGNPSCGFGFQVVNRSKAASMNGHLVSLSPPRVFPPPLQSLWGVGTCGALGYGLVTITPDFGLLVDEICPSVGLSYRWLLGHRMMTACSLCFHPALSVVPWGVGACGPQGCCFVT